MADTVNIIVGAITNGIKWVRQKYREFKVWIAEQLIAALSKGWTAALTIVGLVTASIVVGFVWDILKNNAIVVAVKSFIVGIADTVKRIAAIMQLDLIMAVVNLGVLVNKQLYAQLAPLYEELGSFAEELDLDVSYISTFIEVDRAILQASYSLTNMGWLESSKQFTLGLGDWLGRLRGRLGEYAADPRKIFLDIQNEIAAERVKSSQEELGKIWAALDFAGDWIQDKGTVVISLVGTIDAQVKRLPQEMQDAIRPWWTDAVKRLDDFRANVWGPFWKDYTTFTDGVEDIFLMYGTDIAAIQRRIDDPIDWLRMLLAMPEDEQATLRGTLEEFFGIPPAAMVEAERVAVIPAVIEALDAIEAASESGGPERQVEAVFPLGKETPGEIDTSSSGPALTDEPEGP